MGGQVLSFKTKQHEEISSRLNSLRSRSDDALIAVASLGLVASLVDGRSDCKEIEVLTSELSSRFCISRSRASRIIATAQHRAAGIPLTKLTDMACDAVNEYLDQSQKIHLFSSLLAVVFIDGAVEEAEDDFLQYTGVKLGFPGLKVN